MAPQRGGRDEVVGARADKDPTSLGEAAAGDLTRTIRQEFGISQPGVSQHLKVLREAGFVTVRADGTRRLYATSYERFDEVDAWMDRVRAFWTPHLDALDTEVRRGLSRKDAP